MPPATTRSASPALIACAASITALSPEPQTLFTVTGGIDGGSPAWSAAWRAGFCPTPAWSTFPRITSSTDAGSAFARASASRTTMAPSFGAASVASDPWNFPMGVRHAERRNTSGMAAGSRGRTGSPGGRTLQPWTDRRAPVDSGSYPSPWGAPRQGGAGLLEVRVPPAHGALGLVEEALEEEHHRVQVDEERLLEQRAEGLLRGPPSGTGIVATRSAERARGVRASMVTTATRARSRRAIST